MSIWPGLLPVSAGEATPMSISHPERTASMPLRAAGRILSAWLRLLHRTVPV